IVHAKGFLDWNQALEAAGLQEEAMSEENVEVVRQVLDAYKRGDKAAWTSRMDPELETVPLATWPEPGPFIGPDAAWDFYKQFEEMWAASVAYETTELIGAGNKVFVCQQTAMRGRASAVEVGFKLWAVFTLRDGRFIRAQWFNERSEALEAAGLSE